LRCPDPRILAAALLAVLAPAVHAATAEEVRRELAARIEAQRASAAAAEVVAPAAADATAVLERGKALWTRKFKDGRSLASCYPNGGRRVAASYPLYDSRLKRVVTLETSINQCLKSHHEALYDATDPQTMGAVTAYVRSLAAGQKVQLRVPAAAQERFEQGRRLYFTRLGQRNFACASCHVHGAGRVYADLPLSGAIGQAARWPYVRDGQALTLQAQIRLCLERMGAAPFPAGSDELNHLEYFLTYLSQGLPVEGPGAAR
jgi:L-cysteine S-thiosulfotransferase